MRYEKQFWDYQDEEIKVIKFRNQKEWDQARDIIYADEEFTHMPRSVDIRAYAVPEVYIPSLKKKLREHGLKFSEKKYISGRSLSREAIKERHF